MNEVGRKRRKSKEKDEARKSRKRKGEREKEEEEWGGKNQATKKGRRKKTAERNRTHNLVIAQSLHALANRPMETSSITLV